MLCNVKFSLCPSEIAAAVGGFYFTFCPQAKYFIQNVLCPACYSKLFQSVFIKNPKPYITWLGTYHKIAPDGKHSQKNKEAFDVYIRQVSVERRRKRYFVMFNLIQ